MHARWTDRPGRLGARPPCLAQVRLIKERRPMRQLQIVALAAFLGVAATPVLGESPQADPQQHLREVFDRATKEAVDLDEMESALGLNGLRLGEWSKVAPYGNQPGSGAGLGTPGAPGQPDGVGTEGSTGGDAPQPAGSPPPNRRRTDHRRRADSDRLTEPFGRAVAARTRADRRQRRAATGEGSTSGKRLVAWRRALQPCGPRNAPPLFGKTAAGLEMATLVA